MSFKLRQMSKLRSSFRTQTISQLIFSQPEKVTEIRGAHLNRSRFDLARLVDVSLQLDFGLSQSLFGAVDFVQIANEKLVIEGGVEFFGLFDLFQIFPKSAKRGDVFRGCRTFRGLTEKTAPFTTSRASSYYNRTASTKSVAYTIHEPCL